MSAADDRSDFHWSPRAIEQRLRATPPGWAAFPGVVDRAAWTQIAERMGPARAAELIAAGDRAAAEPTPTLRLSDWRAFTRTGDRQGFETPWFARRGALADLLVGYCLRPEPERLDAVIDLVWAICEETTWCFSAHDPAEFPDPRRPVVDLFASLTAVGLAELAHVLGPDLPTAVRERIVREVRQRVIDLYVDRDDWRWMYAVDSRGVNNWAAVCAFGSAGAACYLESGDWRLASVLAKAARSIEDFLAGFDVDGGTSEGTGYWAFGFGSFVQLAELVRRRTGGGWDWLAAPIVARIASFPLRSRLSLDSWPTFSDSDERVRFPGSLLAGLAERFGGVGLGELAGSAVADWGFRGNSAVSTALRTICAPPVERAAALPPVDRSEWFRGLQWLLARVDPADPDTLALAVKGGDNAELHNQNDVGSLIVRCGGENLIVDPGRGRYTRDYFNAHRYEHFVNRSLGHSVPRPAGCEQGTGAEFRATVVDRVDETALDSVTYDLTAAYPTAAGLSSLRRTVELHRDRARVEVSDEFRFAEPAVAESGYVTFAAVTVGPDRVELRGERTGLTIELASDLTVDLHRETIELAAGPRAVTRIAIRTGQPVPQARISVSIRPAPVG